jgi:hypothetical protein
MSSNLDRPVMTESWTVGDQMNLLWLPHFLFEGVKANHYEFYRIPIRMAIVKKIEDNMFRIGCGEKGTLTHC